MKVFGIGLSKTGTTSLAKALELLGYRTKDCLGVTSYSAGNLSSIEGGVLESYDALTDTPIPSFYQELYQKYPDAKFILTIRDMDSWLKSCQKQFTVKLAAKQTEAHNKLFEDLYESVVFDEDKFRRGYEKFMKSVFDFFQDKPEALLVMNVIKGEGWEVLCPFLGKQIPNFPFPKANVTHIRWMNIESLISIAHATGRKASLLDCLVGIYSNKGGYNIGLTGKLANLLFCLKYIFIKIFYRERSINFLINNIFSDISFGLNSLYPDIPVISPLNHNYSYESRSKWSHFWLIDVCADYDLDGFDIFRSINIALIEDRVPVVGVVYDFLTRKTYYALSWKGAFVEEGGKTQQFQSFGNAIDSAQFVNQNNEFISNPSGKYELYSRRNILLEFLGVADKIQSAKYLVPNSYEWQTAAAHAFINAIGLSLKICDTDNDLKYNKLEWINDCIEIS